MNKSMHYFVTLGAALVALSLPASSRACSCNLGAMLQPQGTGIPLNTKIWIGRMELVGLNGLSPDKVVAVRNARGETLGGGWSTLEAGRQELLVFSPVRELEPNTEYTVSLGNDGRFSFVTGTEHDTEPPPVPVITGQSDHTSLPDFGSTCGDSGSAIVKVSVTSEGSLVVVDRERTSTFDHAAINGRISAFEEGTGELQLSLGSGPCLATWSEAGRGETTRIRVGAYDLAGNFSGFGSEEEIGISVCGCSSASGAFGWLGLVGALALRRRTRRPTA